MIFRGVAAHVREGGSALCAVARRWVGLALFGLMGAVAGLASAAPVQVLTVQDAIGPASADYIVRGLQRARQEGAALVVLSLDTPGGLDTSMRQIVQAILASGVPVATYVSPQGARAASAGTYILYASHIAAMSPATTLGAATPVAIGLPGVPQPRSAPEAAPPAPKPQEAEPAGAPAGSPGGAPQATPLGGQEAMTAKQVHDASAFIRGLAQQHGRNAAWAERAVREAVSLTAEEALREGVIDVVAVDIPDLLAQIDGRRVRMASGEWTLATRGLAAVAEPPDWRHRVLSVIANPSFALMLLMIGIYGLIFEFTSPGFGLPGTVGAICLLLALFALQMLPVNYAALGLILLGFALVAAELLTPAFGVLGVGGVVAFMAGGLLLFDRDVPGMGVPLSLLFGVAVTSALAVFLGGGMALRARRAPVVSGQEDMVGATGRVSDAAADGTWAIVHGERWRVQSEAPLVVGQAVRVTGLKGLTLRVQADPGAGSVVTREGIDLEPGA